MSINLELDPALEAGLRKKAQTEGLSVEDYVQRLVRHDVTMPTEESRAAADRIFESFRGKLGPVPENALDPELLYGDR